MKEKRISLYLTVSLFSKRKENMWECEINITSEKIKNTVKKNKKYLNKYFYYLLYLILYFNIY